MRPLSDKGESANTRYSKSKMVNGIGLANSQLIRLFADYNKCIRVENSMIKIEGKVNGKPERHWFTIWDEKIKYRYNGFQIRVRMVKDETSIIYLFDPKTDTYLGFQVKDYEPAGDLANQTDADRAYMYDHAAKIKADEACRKELQQKILDDLAQSDTEYPVHESMSAPLLLTDKEAPKMEFEDCETQESTAITENSVAQTDSSEPAEETDQIVEMETICTEDIDETEMELDEVTN
jgi:hypothetical protein